MGQMAQKISSVDHKELLKLLNIAFSEEWLAHYQYWVGAKVAKGPMRESIVSEFMVHSKEEFEHAGLIADRIIQLGGTPVLDPKDWEKHALCKYDAPTDEYIMALLKQNLVSERCAISRYKQICDLCMGKDIITFHMSRHIMEEELEHEQDIEDFIADIETSMSHACECGKK